MEKFTVKSLRINAGFTQEEFAKELEMPISTYATREQGKSEWKALEIKAISEKLNIPIERIKYD